MPDYAITISRDKKGNVTFDPSPCNVRAGDIISWRNTDSKAHWPGKVNPDGTVNQTYFMDYKIPKGGTSTAFSPSSVGPIEYACSIRHRGADRCEASETTETGTIVVKAN